MDACLETWPVRQDIHALRSDRSCSLCRFIDTQPCSPSSMQDATYHHCYSDHHIPQIFQSAHSQGRRHNMAEAGRLLQLVEVSRICPSSAGDERNGKVIFQQPWSRHGITRPMRPSLGARQRGPQPSHTFVTLHHHHHQCRRGWLVTP
jgi:hypothetical protein